MVVVAFVVVDAILVVLVFVHVLAVAVITAVVGSRGRCAVVFETGQQRTATTVCHVYSQLVEGTDGSHGRDTDAADDDVSKR